MIHLAHTAGLRLEEEATNLHVESDPLSPFRACHLPFHFAASIDHFVPHLEKISPKVTQENTREREGTNPVLCK